MPTLSADQHELPTRPGSANVHACQGASVDPDPVMLEETIGRLQGMRSFSAAYAELLRLSIVYPSSSMLRVRAAGVALQSEPPRSSDAARLYADAIEMHDAGCRLTPRDLWMALQGMAVAHMQEGEFGAALPWLERGSREFESAPPTRYNHACALCRLTRVDDCLRELDAVVTHVVSADAPDFVTRQDQRGPREYLELFQTDADLAPARHDERFQRLVTRLSERVPAP